MDAGTGAMRKVVFTKETQRHRENPSQLVSPEIPVAPCLRGDWKLSSVRPLEAFLRTP